MDYDEESLVSNVPVATLAPFASAPFTERLAGGGLAFNPLISCHSQKRMAVNAFNEDPQLRISWICFRAGWLVKALHTIFDYLDFSAKSDRQVGRSQVGWNGHGWGKIISGGRPPSLEGLISIGANTNRLVNKFMENLFFR
jgi:hypothetical protein